MAIGAYTMAILVVKADWSFWLAMPAAMVVAMAFGLLVGLPSLRLRADYFAIATIAAAEIVRLTAQNARGLTGGNQGLSAKGPIATTTPGRDISSTIEGWLETARLEQPGGAVPAVDRGRVGRRRCWRPSLLYFAQRSPWGRVLRAIREDEDAARALGKNTLAYKLQSLAISAAMRPRWPASSSPSTWHFLHPTDVRADVHLHRVRVLVLGGLANYWGVAIGSIIMWTLLEGTRFIELPISAEQEAAVRFIIVGLVLILLMAFRPQGIFGNKRGDGAR